MRKRNTRAREAAPPPTWIAPQLLLLTKQPPPGDQWLHEIKLDGYRVHARIEGDSIALLTRTCLNWTDRYEAVAHAVQKLRTWAAYLDGELCAMRSDGLAVA